MIKKVAALASLILVLLVQRPHAQSLAKIYFVDIGTGAGTLIVSPAGKTLLVDGGPPGAGTTKLIPTLDALGIATIDYTVLTHYHIDHDGGLTELFNAHRVTGGTAYDNGDAAGVIPPSLAGSTGVAYTAYKNAVTAGGATRQTIAPGQVIDLGGGMRATCLVVGGRLLSGASVPITNDDLNSESISLLVEYNNFSFIVSGDLTGGGATSTEKSPDVETWVGQLAGDVDVVQLNHHGSTTASNQKFLRALKAEVAVAETGSTNTFGHPNRESVNRFLNTPATNGNTYAGTAQPPAGAGPVFYQIEQSSSSDDRESQQGYFGAPLGAAGTGTILLTTDGTTGYTMQSFDDGGVRISPALHAYSLDAVSHGPTTDFPPTVIPTTSPAAPLATEPVQVSAQINDRESPITGATLSFSLNGSPQAPLAMTLSGGVYVATIPAQPDGTRVDYTVTGTTGPQTTTYSSGYFSGLTPIGTLRALNALGEPAYPGYPARIQGLVTAGSNLFGAATYDDYVEDATGALNIYRSTNGISAFTPLTTGQTVEVVGHLETLGGRFQLDLTDSVEKTSTPYHTTILPNAIVTPAPLAITIAQLNLAPESYEGRLVTIGNVSITSGSIPASPSALDAFVVVSDGTGNFVLKIDHSTDVEGFTPPSVFTLTGIVQQDDFLRPFTTNYDVAPRSRVDLGAAAAAPPPLLTIGDARADLVNNADLNPTPDFIPDRLGQTLKVRGTVTSINFRPTGTEYYIQDATGGIDIFASTTIFGSFGIGTTVEAIGSITQFNGLTELAVTSVTPTGSATPPAPQVVTLSQLADGGVGEALEGRLIRVDNVRITSGLFPASGATGNVTIGDATGSVVMRIDGDTNIDGTPTPDSSSTFTVVALASQFVATPPFDSGYQILSRSLSDIVITGSSALSASPTALDFGSLAVGGSAIRSVTITNVGLSPITLTPPFSTGSTQYTVTVPALTTLGPGAATSVSVTFTPTTAGTKTGSLSITTSGPDSASVSLTGLATSAGGGGATPGVVISEFRTLGPAGGNDEFVEIYNNSDAPIDISGWKMKGSNSSATASTRSTVPGASGSATTMLPARKHYLFVNSAASASLVALANITYGTGITDTGGIAITTAADVIVDQVGMNTGSLYKEGTVLAAMVASATNQQSYERLPGTANGSTQDTNNNVADFVLHLTSIDPQNLASLPTGAIKASPSAVDFGTVAAGGTASATVTVTNTSATALPLTTPFVITGANAADFVIAAPGVSPLPGGSSTTVTISFHPSAAGGKSATATIASPGGTPAVALTGIAAAGISVSPASIDFGSLNIGASATTAVTITNDDPLTPVTLSTPFPITGTNAAEFSVGIPGATTLGGGQSTSLVVGYVPVGAGGKSATLTIASVAGSVRTVSLIGSSACPAITIDGSLTSGILLTPYSRSLVAGGGQSPYTFSVSAGAIPTGLTFSPAGVLSGTPTSASIFNFSVQVADAVGCSGSASYSVPIVAASLALAPSPVAFGTVFLGSHASTPVTITNTSAFPVTLTTPLSITGTDAAQFSVSAPASTALVPGGSTTAQVTFTPSTVGAKSATLSAASTGGGATSVALTGTGHFGASVGSTLLISEFRFRGAGGSSDEFVEIYNNTLSPIDISGYRLMGSNNAGTNSSRATVPAATIIQPHGHYLFVNSAAPAGLLALASQTYGTGITDDGGAAIAMPDATTLLDQVGLSAGSAFQEGTTLPALTASLNQSYERKAGGAAGSTVDTNNNASDFQLITPSDPQNGTSAPVPQLITATPASTDFGAVALGASANATITIANLSTATVTLTPPFVISGADAAQFSVGAPGSSSVAGGSTTTVGVTFTPTTLGAKSASLTMASSNGGTRSVDLLGMASCPAIGVTASLPAGTFGAVYAGSLAASGGASPYAFTSTGTFPPGLTLAADGGVSGTPALAGSYAFTVQATDANGCSGSFDASVAIARAAVHVTWPSPSPIVYGTALGAAQLNATADVAGTFVYTPAAGIVLNAGAGQPLHVVFTPADGVNYQNSSADVTIDVTRGSTQVTWTSPAAIVYGTALGGTQLNATADVAGTFIYTPAAGTVLNAGVGQPLHVVFTPTDGVNYQGSAADVTIDVTRASTHVTWTPPAAIVYGTALGGTQLNATADVAGTFIYTPTAGAVLNAGAGQPLHVAFTPADGVNYQGSTADVTIDVTRASTHATWTTPAAIVYGTTLGGTQLNATADVAGTFIYTPAAGTVLNAGVGQPLHVVFTPADGVNYQSGTADVALTVTKASVTATAVNASREFGAANPAFTGTVVGVVNGDAITGSFTSAATPASPEGLYPIAASLLDPGGRLANYTVSLVNGTLTVVDTYPPVLTLPSAVSVRATTPPGGAVVSYTASASDPVDGARPIACSPASGSTFPIGATTVHCSATDSNGHMTAGSFTVTVLPFVKNPKPPKVTAPKNMKVEATGPAGAVVTFTASATDPQDGALPVTCAPASGSVFALGATTVTCSATNSFGKTDTDTAVITVRDTTDPAIVSVTPSVTLLPNTDQTVPVSIAVVATDVVDPAPACQIARVTGGGRDLDNDGVIDWTITGPLSLNVQSVARRHRDRTYTITVKCTDASGNTSREKTTIVVSRINP